MAQRVSIAPDVTGGLSSNPSFASKHRRTRSMDVTSLPTVANYSLTGDMVTLPDGSEAPARKLPASANPRLAGSLLGTAEASINIDDAGLGDDDDALAGTLRDQLRTRSVMHDFATSIRGMGQLGASRIAGSPGRSPGAPARPLHWADNTKINAKNIFELMSKKKKGIIDGEVLPNGHNDYYNNPANIALLEKGGCLFSFTTHTASELTGYETEMIDAIINLSSFDNEQKENGVPLFDVNDHADAKKYTFILQKCSYILPGLQVVDVSPKLISSTAYQKGSQPASSYVWEDCTFADTFRISKTIVRFIFSLTLQFKVSRISESVLPRLSEHLGIQVDAGILLERTRRKANSAPDSTAKVKSVLLYTRVDGGLLVTNFTVALQSSLPGVVSKLMNSFGSMGLAEVSETAANTRTFLKGHLGLK